MILASDDGVLREFNPLDGALISTVPVASGAATNPIIAGNSLYVVAENGTLIALR